MDGKGWILRFASRLNDRRSAIWRCFRPEGRGDVYLGTRSTLPAIKLSLHESGSCHIAFDLTYFRRKQAEGFFPEEADRWVHRWERPDLTTPGHLVAFRVVMPSISVTAPVLPDEESKDVHWLQAPAVPLGNHVALALVRGPEDPPMGSGRLIGKTDLPNSDRLLLVSQAGPIPPVSFPGRPPFRPLLTDMPDLTELAAAGTLRTIISGATDDGTPLFLDVAVAAGSNADAL